MIKLESKVENQEKNKEFHKTLDFLFKESSVDIEKIQKLDIDESLESSINNLWNDNINNYIDSLKPKDVIILVEAVKYFNKSTAFMKELRYFIDSILKYLNEGEPLKSDFGKDKFTNIYSLYSFSSNSIKEEVKDTALIYNIMEKFDSFNFTNSNISESIDVEVILNEVKRKLNYFDSIRENHIKRKRYLIILNGSKLTFTEPLNINFFVQNKVKCTFLSPQKFSEVEKLSKLFDYNGKSNDVTLHLNLTKWLTFFSNGLLDAVTDKNQIKRNKTDYGKELTDVDYDLINIMNYTDNYNIDSVNNSLISAENVNNVSKSNFDNIEKSHSKFVATCQSYKMQVSQMSNKISSQYGSQENALTPNNNCNVSINQNVGHISNSSEMVADNSFIQMTDNRFVQNDSSKLQSMNFRDSQMRFSQPVYYSNSHKQDTITLFDGHLRYNNDDVTHLKITCDSNINTNFYSMNHWESQSHLKFCTINDYFKNFLFGNRNENSKDTNEYNIRVSQEINLITSQKAIDFIKEYLSQKSLFGFVRPNKNINPDFHVQMFCIILNGDIKAFIPADPKGLLEEMRKSINQNMSVYDQSRRVAMFPNQHLCNTIPIQSRPIMNRYASPQQTHFMPINNAQLYRPIQNPHTYNMPIHQGFLVNPNQYQSFPDNNNMISVEGNIQQNHIFDKNNF